MTILQQSDLNSKNVFSHSSEGWKFTIKVVAAVVSLEASLF
jgi:hypothetical protein